MILNVTRNKLFVKRFWRRHGVWTTNVIADMVLAVINNCHRLQQTTSQTLRIMHCLCTLCIPHNCFVLVELSNVIVVIHLFELGFILLTYCVQEFGSVAGVGEKFLMTAKLKPLCGGKFVIHRRDTQSVGILAYSSSVMWPCLYRESETILCWKIRGLAGHLCVFFNQKFVFWRLCIGRNDDKNPPPRFHID